MDLMSRVRKLSNRKRLHENVTELREKVSKEKFKLLKTKVSQDTLCWEIQENLHQTKNEHERLKQKMVDVQMQHEAVSGQYNSEIGLRPETLNKVKSTHDICNVMNEYVEQLKESHHKCKIDLTTLSDVYQKCALIVKDLKLKQTQDNEKNKQLIDNWQDRVNMQRDVIRQAEDFFTTANQETDDERADLEIKLEKILVQKNKLSAIADEQRKNLELLKYEIDKKNETTAHLQNNLKQLLHETDGQVTNMRNAIVKKENENKEAMESIVVLKTALKNQELFTKTICDENRELQEKTAALEEKNQTIKNQIMDLENSLKDASVARDGLKRAIAVENNVNDELEIKVNQKLEEIENVNVEIIPLRSKLVMLETEKQEIGKQLSEVNGEVSAKSAGIVKLIDVVQNLECKIKDMENIHESYKESTELKIKELTNTVVDIDKELDSKIVIIDKLKLEVKTVNNVVSNMEGEVTLLEKELEIENNINIEREENMNKQCEKLKNLESAVKKKEEELSQQMLEILEKRKEKVKLEEALQNLQNTRNNIEKKLFESVSKSEQQIITPEHENNVVMLQPETEVEKGNLPLGNQTFPRTERTGAVTVSHTEAQSFDEFKFFDSRRDRNTVDVQIEAKAQNLQNTTNGVQKKSSELISISKQQSITPEHEINAVIIQQPDNEVQELGGQRGIFQVQELGGQRGIFQLVQINHELRAKPTSSTHASSKGSRRPQDKLSRSKSRKCSNEEKRNLPLAPPAMPKTKRIKAVKNFVTKPKPSDPYSFYSDSSREGNSVEVKWKETLHNLKNTSNNIKKKLFESVSKSEQQIITPEHENNVVMLQPETEVEKENLPLGNQTFPRTERTGAVTVSHTEAQSFDEFKIFDSRRDGNTVDVQIEAKAQNLQNTTNGVQKKSSELISISKQQSITPEHEINAVIIQQPDNELVQINHELRAKPTSSTHASSKGSRRPQDKLSRSKSRKCSNEEKRNLPLSPPAMPKIKRIKAVKNSVTKPKPSDPYSFYSDSSEDASDNSADEELLSFAQWRDTSRNRNKILFKNKKPTGK